MLKIINKPSDDMLFALKSLVNDRCPYPNCNKKAQIIVSCFNRHKDVEKFENSIVFCEDHALLCQQGKVDERLFWDIRQLLKPNRLSEENKKSHILSSREEYLSGVVNELKHSSTLRCIYVGPLPFHPEWYFTMYEGKFHISGMDQAVYHALEDPNISVSIILRNTKRYIEKVKDLIPESFFGVLVDETVNNFARLMDPIYNNNCILLDTGPFHIPIIFDNACIFATRSSDSKPINGGLLTYDEKQVEWEKQAFNRLLKNRELFSSLELKNFLSKALSKE